MKNITTWSYTSLKTFEKCPLHAYKQYVEKCSTDHMDKTALNRGIEVHTACELFVKGEGDFTPEMKKFAPYFDEIRREYENGDVEVEENWGFSCEWQPTGWWDKDVWCRMKLDNFRILSRDDDGNPLTGKPTDYKTGKKFGNEVSHGQQGQLYALGTFLRYPSLEHLEVEIIYLDQGQTLKRSYTREQAMKFLPHWTERGNKMVEATDYPPKPNKMTCMWCPFGPQHGDKSCEWGV